ncbi:zinc finger protein [Fusarium acutatum]|uniref:Zinc finger protein n=1 Tax=Fusarium acutatum TaxID=78861 RepID=A0A8H4JYS6_9HYPO|nr:zinc finger protein [Fusarium acutatum]
MVIISQLQNQTRPLIPSAANAADISKAMRKKNGIIRNGITATYATHAMRVSQQRRSYIKTCTLRNWIEETGWRDFLVAVKGSIEKNKASTFYCNVCRKNFEEEVTLSKHLKGKHKHTYCCVCKTHFASPAKKQKHVMSSLSAKPGTFFCDHCDPKIRFGSEKELCDHLWLEHMACGPCGQVFETAELKKKHDAEAHNSTVRPIKVRDTEKQYDNQPITEIDDFFTWFEVAYWYKMPQALALRWEPEAISVQRLVEFCSNPARRWGHAPDMGPYRGVDFKRIIEDNDLLRTNPLSNDKCDIAYLILCQIVDDLGIREEFDVREESSRYWDSVPHQPGWSR